jgi:ribonucleotide reductase beta subunit family protein with ferritin-like domain
MSDLFNEKDMPSLAEPSLVVAPVPAARSLTKNDELLKAMYGDVRPASNTFAFDLVLGTRKLVFPKFKYPELYAMYIRGKASFWIHDEINYQHDAENFQKLAPHIQKAILGCLKFFALIDSKICDNLSGRFQQECQIPEIGLFYSMQNEQEQVHALTYSQMAMRLLEKMPHGKQLISYILEDVPLEGDATQFAKEMKFESVTKMYEWVHRYYSADDLTLTERILAFSMVEGLLFAVAFAIFIWCRTKKLLPGCEKANEFIMRDENLHTEFAIDIYKRLSRDGLKIVDTRVTQMVRGLVEVIHQFVHDVIPEGLDDIISVEAMKNHVLFLANFHCNKLGHSMPFSGISKSPLEFLHSSTGMQKTNFFDNDATEYVSRAGNSEEDDLPYDQEVEC